MNPVISFAEWEIQQLVHRSRAEQWTLPHRKRKLSNEREPVMDFLFEYYPYSPAKLEQWFPGCGWDIEVADDLEFTHGAFIRSGNTFTLDPVYINKNQRRIQFVIELLNGIESRSASFNCFGLHEWAMVYQAPIHEIRHPDPLRISPQKIADTVDTFGLRCTHIDAFRFFTPEAAPLNANEAGLIPSRENQTQLDQSGCLHANMDLYKYCMWLQPLVPGDLVLDCFELAVQTRTVDMQASPYDLSAFDYSPIPIEHTEGRAEYVARQREISAKSHPLRRRLMAVLIHSIEHEAARSRCPRGGQHDWPPTQAAGD
jgi:hypothetical protein